jgi:fructan beta-fructosidase
MSPPEESTRRSRARRRRPLLAAMMAIFAACTAIVAAAGSTATAQTSAVTYQEPFRPQFHYTPAKNWMNDPNGLVWYKGEYHLFYQYNPSGTTWGNISWGHAVSRDLVHWQELPVAIPDDDKEFVFSGSVVVDKDNTSGFGTRQNPPMVAIYTSASKACCKQAQALAYSTDRGRTWTKYAGNPVLDIGSGEFRDPKVFWYAPGNRWIMAVVLAVDRKVSFYGSKNLKDWTHLSDFGPANAVGGVWEVPDLFPLPVDGNPGNIKWVLIVNLNPGGIAGGSAAQYFVGDFDGTTFRAENVLGPYTPPAGDVYQNFEGPDYGTWTTTGTAFGDAPAHGSLPGQLPVTGFLGNGLANSFLGGDASLGKLTSPPFKISRPYINFLVGGGSHAHEPGTVEGPPPPGTVFADFEGSTYGPGWTTTGTAFGSGPAHGTLPNQQTVSGFLGTGLVNSYLGGDATQGTLASPSFTITSNYINFLVGGGSHPYPGDAQNPPTAVNLVVDGQVVATATGHDSEQLNWTNWNVSALKGRTAHLEMVDLNTGGWGHILADQVTFADQPALPRSLETAVDLVVGGNVVRTSSGEDSEHLDWSAWNVKDLIGRDAQIQIVDNNSGGWGHILADQITFADAPALSVKQRSSWVDYGKDFYAVNSWNDVPGGKRIAIAWMNNWEYAGVIPTSPWRSAMSVPREFALRTIDGRPQLVQQPIRQLRELRVGPTYQLRDRTVQAGTLALTGKGASGKALDIEAEFDPATGNRFGLKVRTGGDEETVIGYDVDARELYVDRTKSGNVGFAATFPGVQRAPLALRDGKVSLHILVDWSSVEVFAADGERAITDQVFPSDTSAGVELFSEGGTVKLDSLTIRHMRSIWQRFAPAGG